MKGHLQGLLLLAFSCACAPSGASSSAPAAVSGAETREPTSPKVGQRDPSRVFGRLRHRAADSLQVAMATWIDENPQPTKRLQHGFVRLSPDAKELAVGLMAESGAGRRCALFVQSLAALTSAPHRLDVCVWELGFFPSQPDGSKGFVAFQPPEASDPSSSGSLSLFRWESDRYAVERNHTFSNTVQLSESRRPLRSISIHVRNVESLQAPTGRAAWRQSGVSFSELRALDSQGKVLAQLPRATLRMELGDDAKRLFPGALHLGSGRRHSALGDACVVSIGDGGTLHRHLLSERRSEVSPPLPWLDEALREDIRALRSSPACDRLALVSQSTVLLIDPQTWERLQELPSQGFTQHFPFSELTVAVNERQAAVAALVPGKTQWQAFWSVELDERSSAKALTSWDWRKRPGDASYIGVRLLWSRQVESSRPPTLPRVDLLKVKAPP